MIEIPEHEEDHHYIKEHRASSEERRKQWQKVYWSLVTTGLVGAITSLIAALGYALTVFIERGGQ